MTKLFLAALVWVALATDERRSHDAAIGPPQDGAELIGRPAPSLDGLAWQDDRARLTPGRTGKLLLVRWWTDHCVLCENTAPALRALSEKYADRLDVLAIFHEKPKGSLVGVGEIGVAAKRLGLPFVIAEDRGWKILERWWLGAGGRSFTSVSFLIDRDGKIALVHSGGEFHDAIAAKRCARTPEQCAEDYRRIDREIARLAAAR